MSGEGSVYYMGLGAGQVIIVSGLEMTQILFSHCVIEKDPVARNRHKVRARILGLYCGLEDKTGGSQILNFRMFICLFIVEKTSILSLLGVVRGHKQS